MKNKIHLSVNQDSKNQNSYTVEFDEAAKTREPVYLKITVRIGIFLCFLEIVGFSVFAIIHQFNESDLVASLVFLGLVVVSIIFLLIIINIQMSRLKYVRKADLIEKSLDTIESLLTSSPQTLSQASSPSQISSSSSASSSSQENDISSVFENYFATLSDL